ncbi:MAG: HupE/UreJ family protein [Alphaproteobacteria bacterium]|nr:HupE/UreJ family protein [Alphaproteobacteria bacterium]
MCAPAPAEAHTALKSMGAFWSGAAHLLSSLDEIGFLVGLAIWAGFAERRNDPRIVAACFGAVFAGALAAGVSSWQLDPSLPTAGLMLAVGVAGAARLRAAPLPVLALAVIGGVLGGIAGGDAATGLSAVLSGLGAAIAAAAVVSYVFIAVRGFNAAWAAIAWRAGASWVAAIGLMILALDCSRYLGRR